MIGLGGQYSMDDWMYMDTGTLAELLKKGLDKVYIVIYTRAIIKIWFVCLLPSNPVKMVLDEQI